MPSPQLPLLSITVGKSNSSTQVMVNSSKLLSTPKTNRYTIRTPLLPRINSSQDHISTNSRRLLSSSMNTSSNRSNSSRNNKKSSSRCRSNSNCKCSSNNNNIRKCSFRRFLLRKTKKSGLVKSTMWLVEF